MAKSDFEKNAQQAAVEAVEKRWRQKNAAERRQRFRKRLGNLFAIVILLAGLVGVGCFAVRYFELDIPIPTDFDTRDIVVGLGGGCETSKAEIDRRNEYVRLLASFKGKECIQWRDAPAAIKPKTAVAGVRYLVLCEERGDKRLYELVSDGRGSMVVVALSPLTEPIRLEMKDFKEAVNGKPYFILCNDVLYVVGCKNELILQGLKDSLLR